jgi:hypothetical protein
VHGRTYIIGRGEDQMLHRVSMQACRRVRIIPGRRAHRWEDPEAWVRTLTMHTRYQPRSRARWVRVHMGLWKHPDDWERVDREDERATGNTNEVYPTGGTGNVWAVECLVDSESGAVEGDGAQIRGGEEMLYGWGDDWIESHAWLDNGGPLRVGQTYRIQGTEEEHQGAAGAALTKWRAPHQPFEIVQAHPSLDEDHQLTGVAYAFTTRTNDLGQITLYRFEGRRFNCTRHSNKHADQQWHIPMGG